MPKVESVSSSTASASAGAENAGQPQPESYLASEAKSSAPQPAHLYVPGSKLWSYSPVNGRSVPFSRKTRYCSGLSSARHCSSVFWILFTLNSLPRAPGVTPMREPAAGTEVAGAAKPAARNAPAKRWAVRAKFGWLQLQLRHLGVALGFLVVPQEAGVRRPPTPHGS